MYRGGSPDLSNWPKGAFHHQQSKFHLPTFPCPGLEGQAEVALLEDMGLPQARDTEWPLFTDTAS